MRTTVQSKPHTQIFTTACLIAFALSVYADTCSRVNAAPPETRIGEPLPAEVNFKAMPAFQDLADKTPMQLAWNARTVEEHNAWRKKMRAKLLELLGRMPERVPLEVKWHEKKGFPTLVRHKIYVRTEANYWAPAYFFVPKKLSGKTPAIVCLHGHSGIYPYIREGSAAEKAKCKDHSLDYAVYMAEHGYVTIALVVRGWNETAADMDAGIKNPRSCRRVTMDTFMMGMTPMGLRCWDAMRLVDFLQTRPEVDPERIGLAGLSGGGTLSLYMPVLDQRIKLVMIAGAFSSYRTSIYSIRHCICNCLPGIMLADYRAQLTGEPYFRAFGGGRSAEGGGGISRIRTSDRLRQLPTKI